MWIKIGIGYAKKEDETNVLVTIFHWKWFYLMLYSVKQEVRVLGNIKAPDAHEEEALEDSS